MKILSLNQMMHLVAVWVSLAATTLQAEDGQAVVAGRLQGFIDRQVISGGVMLVAQHGKVLSLNAVGLADIEASRPMRLDTLFWIASMTKPLTASAVMILQDDGKLSIDDPVGKYLPEFNEVALSDRRSPKRPITIADLLSHTSGVANPSSGVLGDNPTLAQVASAIAQQPLQFEPGSEWKYGSGLTVVGRIVEIVSGQPFDDFLGARICQPLAMNDTTFYPSAAQRERLATIYRWDRERTKLAPAPAPFNRTDGMRRAPNPSGGLCSTAPDYFRFLQMVANGGELIDKRIMSPAAAKQMVALHTGDMKAGHSAGMGWTLGWGIVREAIGLTAALSTGSYGHGGAFGTIGWIDPTRDAVMILMIARSDMNAAQETEIRAEMIAAGVKELSAKNN